MLGVIPSEAFQLFLWLIYVFFLWLMWLTSLIQPFTLSSLQSQLIAFSLNFLPVIFSGLKLAHLFISFPTFSSHSLFASSAKSSTFASETHFTAKCVIFFPYFHLLFLNFLRHLLDFRGGNFLKSYFSSPILADLVLFSHVFHISSQIFLQQFTTYFFYFFLNVSHFSFHIFLQQNVMYFLYYCFFLTSFLTSFSDKIFFSIFACAKSSTFKEETSFRGKSSFTLRKDDFSCECIPRKPIYRARKINFFIKNR